MGLFPLKMAEIKETKIQIYSKDDFRKVTKDFQRKKDNTHTGLNKGLCVSIKSIVPFGSNEINQLVL